LGGISILIVAWTMAFSPLELSPKGIQFFPGINAKEMLRISLVAWIESILPAIQFHNPPPSGFDP